MLTVRVGYVYNGVYAILWNVRTLTVLVYNACVGIELWMKGFKQLKWLWKSLKVIGIGAIRHNFPLVFHCNHVLVLYTVSEICQVIGRKSKNLPNSRVFGVRDGPEHGLSATSLTTENIASQGFQAALFASWYTFSYVDRTSACDGRTVTDRHRSIAYTALCVCVAYTSCGKICAGGYDLECLFKVILEYFKFGVALLYWALLLWDPLSRIFHYRQHIIELSNNIFEQELIRRWDSERERFTTTSYM